MRQTAQMSAMEVSINIGSGFMIAWIVTFFILPLWGYKYSVSESLEITIFYTFISWCRSYFWRRFFVRMFK